MTPTSLKKKMNGITEWKLGDLIQISQFCNEIRIPYGDDEYDIVISSVKSDLISHN